MILWVEADKQWDKGRINMLILQTGSQATAWLRAKFTKRVQAFQSFALRCFVYGRLAQRQQTCGSWMKEVPKDRICQEKNSRCTWGVIHPQGNNEGRGGGMGEWRIPTRRPQCLWLHFRGLAEPLHSQGAQYLRIFALRSCLWPSS